MIALATRIAARELRGGLAGFRVFLACLALGVAAIAGVGMVRAAIEGGLRDQGAVLLGGDAQMAFTYRFATDPERAYMAKIANEVSEIVDFRSMVVTGSGDAEDRALTQVKAVDGAYPLTGAVTLETGALAEALAGADGLPGAVMDKVLVDRLELAVGDRFRLGVQEFRLGAVLLREPDSATGGFALGPRTIVLTTGLAKSGLLEPGTLFDTAYRLRLPSGANLAQMEQAAETRFSDAGMRWSDSRRAAPGVERFVDRIGAFLILVGLAGLAVGGVGVASAVRAYLEGKVATIATLKVLGATGGMVFAVYLIQIGALAVLGVALGLGLGVGVPMLAAPLIESALPFPAEIALYPKPLAEAAFYGLTTAFLFTLWPLARSRSVRAAALYRGVAGGWPGFGALMAIAGLAVLLVGGAVWFSGTAMLALGSAGGVVASLAVLALAALGLRALARRLTRGLRGRVAWRLAFGAIGGRGSEAMSVILSLGLGLSVLAAVGQIDANLRSAIDRDLPARAPSFFFVDLQPDQIEGFLARVKGDPAVTKSENAPMLRGVITQINGRPAREVGGEHWVLTGDRGVTYSALPPSNATVTAGTWWPEDYDGPPQISFAAEEAEEIGLKLGDMLTINVLGRDIDAEVTSFRLVDFSSAGMGFVLSMNPTALQGAPHTYISTVYSSPESEAALLRDVSRAYPNITAIRVRDAVDRVSEALGAIAQATAWAASATLLTGFVVLIGAAAAGTRVRVYEAALLKVLGASRGRILLSFALRSALMGAAAGTVAVLAGGVVGWAVMVWVMEADYTFEPVSAFAIVLGGVIATLLAGLVFAWGPLAARPAQVLRAQD
jgi:putative ABC transport system permease protein